VVLHLHNYRLFCSIATCFRDGEPCFRCRGRFTLPGLVLNCRGSVPESAAYTAALALHQPAVFENVDRFVTPSDYAAGQLERLGLPRERVSVVANYLPADDFADASLAHEGQYAVAFGRLSEEKGFATAVEAAAVSGVPLRVAGDGPLAPALRAQTGAIEAPVEFVGQLGAGELRSLLRGAAMAVVPSVGGDVMPFAALEAMAAGLPVVASRSGSLPEVVGEERCVPRRDPQALAAAMRRLWDDPHARRADGDAVIARARDRFGEGRYVEELKALYEPTGRR
jgi:glycosyltransferase involved in cell wall biosynthesis